MQTNPVMEKTLHLWSNNKLWSPSNTIKITFIEIKFCKMII